MFDMLMPNLVDFFCSPARRLSKLNLRAIVILIVNEIIDRCIYIYI